MSDGEDKPVTLEYRAPRDDRAQRVRKVGGCVYHAMTFLLACSCMMLFFASAWAAVSALILTLFPLPASSSAERLAILAIGASAVVSAAIWLMLGMRIVRESRE